MFELKLLGACELCRADGTPVALPTRKALGLLAYIAVQSGQRASRDALANLLWEGSDAPQARSSLRQALNGIRQIEAEHPIVIADPELIRLDPATVNIDALEFLNAVAQGDDAGLARASELYCGDFLGDFSIKNAPAFHDWAVVKRQQLRAAAIEALSSGLDRASARSSPEAAIQAAIRLLNVDPLQEHAHRALMRLYARQRRHGAALKHYHDLTAMLQRELGVAPEPETRALFIEISQNRRSAATISATRSGYGDEDADIGAVDVPADDPGRPADTSPADAGGRKRKHWAWIAAAGTVAVLGLATAPRLGLIDSADVVTAAKQPTAAAPRRSVAVLPFVNFSTHADGDPFADGLTEEVINSLANVSDLKVAGRTSSFYFKGRNEDLREIGRKLGVAHVLEGSVRRTGDKLRVTAQLINVEDGFHLWSQTYDRTMNDAFAIQEDIARAVAKELETRLPPAAGSPATSDPQSYQLYLVAKAHLRNSGPKDDLTARRLFAQLIEREPENPRALAGYARATMRLAQQHKLLEFEAARTASDAAIDKALRIDPRSMDAHIAQGVLKSALASWTGQRRYDIEALAAFRRAFELAPRNPEALSWYAHQIGRTGEVDETAISYLRQAVSADPLDRFAHVALGSALANAGRFDDSLIQFTRAAELFPDLTKARMAVAETYMKQGALDRAANWLTRSNFAGTDNNATIRLAQVYANLGMLDEARTLLGRLRGSPELDMAARIYRLQLDRDHAGALKLARSAARDADSGFQSSVLVYSGVTGDIETAARLVPLLAPELLVADPMVEGAMDRTVIAAHALNRTGQSQQARRILTKLLRVTTPQPNRDQSPETLAARINAYAELGDDRGALAELRRAIDKGFRLLVEGDYFLHLTDYPSLARLRTDPAFQAMLREIETDNARMRARVSPTSIAVRGTD